MEKRGKYIICTILIVWITFFITDFSLAKANKSPVFAIPVLRHKDGGSVEYYGLGYKVIKYINFNVESGSEVANVDFGTWFMKFSPTQATPGSDGEITSTVDASEIPIQNNQSNFGDGYEYQYVGENIIDVYMNEKWIRFEKETKDRANKNYDRISEYMKEESTAAFSPYYQLLDFQISNYVEEVDNGDIEATFFYKIIHKNFDKDPDTVGYIKAAKESGNKNYQQMYDEYLAPKEMNFDLKVVIDKDDKTTLYSNISPNGIEWDETKMTDFILSK